MARGQQVESPVNQMNMGCLRSVGGFFPVVLILAIFGCGGADAVPADASASDATVEDTASDAFGFGDMPLPPPVDAALVDVDVPLEDGGVV